jgi:hypothetical protein
MNTFRTDFHFLRAKQVLRVQGTEYGKTAGDAKEKMHRSSAWFTLGIPADFDLILTITIQLASTARLRPLRVFEP